MPLRIALSLVSLFLLPLAIAAADDAPSATRRGPKTEEFYRVQAEMNALLGELADLQTKYRTADQDKQAEIKQQYQDVVAKGFAIEPRLVDAAENAYAEAPNADPKIAELLVNLLGEKVTRDDYEPAAEIGKLLMENKCRAKPVPNLAGIAAFNVNDFETAEKYLGQAAADGRYLSIEKEDKLGTAGANCLRTIGYYKKVWPKERDIREREADSDNLPRVLLKTSKGDIVIELFENQAPNTVANFIYLVQRGFYNGLSFHRVLPGFMAQGGERGDGGPGYSIACECYRPDHRLHFRGTLSMAHAGRDTGGSQFFLTFAPTSHLDGVYTAFGRVIEGMDVLAKLQRRDPTDPEAPRADKIIEAKVIRKRPHEYKPQKIWPE